MTTGNKKGFRQLGTLIAEVQNQICQQQGDNRYEIGCRRFLDESEPQNHSGINYSKIIFACTASFIAVSSLIFIWTAYIADPTLTFRVSTEQQPGIAQKWIHAPKLEPISVTFSDGTSIDLHAKSIARIESIKTNGARIRLKSGGAKFRVVPHKNADWKIVAGPFNITVTGTVFDVSWIPTSQLFNINLHQGSVVVSGPVLTTDQLIQKGQALQVSISRRLARLSEKNSTVSSQEQLQVIKPALPQVHHRAIQDLTNPLPREQRSTPKTDKKHHRDRPRIPSQVINKRSLHVKNDREKTSHERPYWKVYADQGKYKKALDSLSKGQFEALCNNLEAEDLLRLAEVARFAGNVDYGKKALLSLRSRFPRRREAYTAAYTLGRTLFDQQSNYLQAAHWFEVYIKEHPSGPLANESLGRLMEAQQKAGLISKARRTAQRYLEKYPRGAHSDIAKELTSQNSTTE